MKTKTNTGTLSQELVQFLAHLKENIEEVLDEEYDENQLGDSLEEAKYIGRVCCLQDLAESLESVPEYKETGVEA